jgi:hypothetical protein
VNAVPAALERAEPESAAGHIFSGVCATLDQAGIPYAILHGYEDYPQRIASDVDAVIGDVTPRALCALFARNRDRIGADVVRCGGALFVLAGRDPGGALRTLSLDLTRDVALDAVPFYSGREMLARRRRLRSFWIPPADLAFGSYLARSIGKERLDDARARRLSGLYAEDPVGCQAQVARFWGPRSAALIVAAAESGDWSAVQQQIGRLQRQLRRRAVLCAPGAYVANRLRTLRDRCGRLLRPDGLSVVLLGSDGAGKSSAVEALAPTLSGVFDRVSYRGFAASPRDMFSRAGARSTSQPHALPPRSYLISLLRGVYWLGYYTASRISLRAALARSSSMTAISSISWSTPCATAMAVPHGCCA